MKKLFYHAYIAPTFDYACVTWSCSKKSELNRISKLQKRAARIITNSDNNTNSRDLFNDLNWLKFDSRCKYFTNLLVYKALNNLAPSYIHLISLSNNEKYELRSTTRKDIIHKKPNTNYLKRTFSYSSMETWNQLPVELRITPNLKTFKSKLKLFLKYNE
jgi:hypothetical protein